MRRIKGPPTNEPSQSHVAHRPNSRRRRGVVAVFASLGLLLVWATPASATWSIVGTDQTTGEVGVAIASCVPVEALGDLSQPLPPVILVPNKGAAVSQALLNAEAARKIRELVEIDRAPDEIVNHVITEAFDEEASQRQHGVVTFSGAPSGFTGSDNQTFAGDVQAPGVSVQGNLLASEAVVDDALAAFEAAPQDPLADRLLAALVAGSEAGGDVRCGEQTALFAHLVVAKPGDDPFDPSLMLTFASPDGGDNPVVALNAAFQAGERTLVEVPSIEGDGSIFGLIALILGLLMIPAGVLYWRWAYRKPRY